MCRRSDHESKLLLCDCCDCAYHMQCLGIRSGEIPSVLSLCAVHG